MQGDLSSVQLSSPRWFPRVESWLAFPSVLYDVIGIAVGCLMRVWAAFIPVLCSLQLCQAHSQLLQYMERYG